MTIPRTLQLIVIGVAGLLSASALAQPEDPPKKKAPRTSANALDVSLSDEIVDAFRVAYEEDDFPRWLTVVGVDARAFGGDADHRNIAGQDSPILFFDPTGISDMLQTRLNFWLKKNRGLDLLNLSEMSDADRRRANGAGEVDAEAGLEMLADRVRADLVLYMEIRAVPDDLRGEGEGLLVVTTQLRDRRTQRSVFEDSFRWDGRADVRYMNFLAVKTLERLLPEYIDWVENRPAHSPVELAIYGLTDAQQLEIRGILSEFNGIAGRVRSDVQRRGETTLTNLSFRYRGDIAALLVRLNRVTAEDLGIEFRTLDFRENSATLSAMPVKNDEGWVRFADADAPGREEAVAELLRGYQRRGSPRIGVLIDPADEQTGFNIRALTAEFNNRFSEVGLNVEAVMGNVEGDLRDLGFEIIVLGESNNDPDAKGGMVFSVYDARSDRFIASQNWPDRSAINSRTRPITPGDREQVSGYIAGRLLERMARDFAASGTVDVVMHFPKDTRVVTAFARALEDTSSAVVSASNIDAGPECASFVIRYNGRFEELVAQVEAVQDRFPIALAGASADSATIELVVLEEGQTLADVEIPAESPCAKRRLQYTRPDGSGPELGDGKPDAPEPVRPAPSDPPPGTTPVRPTPEPTPVRPGPGETAPDEPVRPAPERGSREVVRLVKGANDELLKHQLELAKADSRISVTGYEGQENRRRSVSPIPEGAEQRLAFDGIMVIRKPEGPAPNLRQGLTFDALQKAVIGEIEVVRGRRGTAAQLNDQGLRNELQTLRADPTVAAAIPNYIMYSNNAAEPVLQSGHWALSNAFNPGSSTDWSRVADRVAKIKPALIGLVDGGMHLEDPRLKPMLWVNRGEIAGNGVDDDGNKFIDDVHGYNFVTDNADITYRPDSFSHGSFCGSIIGARAVGGPTDVMSIAPQSTIIMANVFADEPNSGAQLQHVLNGIIYAASNGAKVINLSLGSEISPAQLTEFAKALEPLFKLFQENNVIIVVAAGNSAVNNDVKPGNWANLPFDNIITVAATDAEGDLAKYGQLGSWKLFTNYGAKEVDIAAPGALIYGVDTLGTTKSGNGTSYAAPMVTAAVALVQGQHPEWDYKTVIRAILETARPYEALQGKVRTGGALDIEAALNWTP